MDIKSVSSVTPSLQTPTPPAPTAQAFAEAQASQGPQDQISLGSKALKNSLKLTDNLRAVSDEINSYAKFVRHTDAVLEKASNQLELMKKPLELIIKNYPPFPPGSEQRADLLRSYISLRKEIDRLTVPPPQDLATPALARLFSDLFDAEGKFKAGSTLGIPEDIPHDAGDRQIISVIEKVDTAKMQIDRGRTELSTSLF
jgi:hypothetical protein